MRITNLDKEKVLTCAQAAFPQSYIELDTADFYLPSIEKGMIQIDEESHPYYVNTHYAYEDHLVNGNQTRYKVVLTVFFVKDDPFTVLYDTKDNYYVAFVEDGEVTFLPYEAFHAHVLNAMKILEES